MLSAALMWSRSNDAVIDVITFGMLNSRALHTKLKYSSRNSSQNKFFAKIKILFWCYYSVYME